MTKHRSHNYSYRTSIEQHWRCPRMGYLHQFYLGGGIKGEKSAYYMDVGIAVHIGLSEMLMQGAKARSEEALEASGEHAVKEALEYWDTCGQQEALTEYQFSEQRCLVEGLLWAFYYHTLRVFLETYEVLWAEKEITEVVKGRPTFLMMSRPDALVRERATGDIVVISWKTIDTVSAYRRLFFKQDLQGMMEQWYSEQWLKEFNRRSDHPVYSEKVAYVQTIYLVKGARTRKDAKGDEEDVGDAFAEEAMGDEWRQNTHLIYPYSSISEHPHAEVEGLGGAKCTNTPVMESLAWKYRHVKPGNKSFSTLGKAFKKTLVTNTSMSAREWVCALSKGIIFPSTLPTETAGALDKCIVWENPSYRDEGLMKSVIAQVKESERRRHRDKKHMATFDYECTKPQRVRLTAKGEQVTFSQDLDRLFPMQLVSCSFPWKCQFQNVCHSEEGRKALTQLEMPKGYVPRVPHHEPEANHGKEKQ